jgi:hypothetical protein
VHTRLTDEVEAWKILRSLEMVRAMGAPTIVEYFPWAYSEGIKGEFSWVHADTVVDFARNQGLTVVARLGGLVPEWARPEPDEAPTVDTYLDAEHFADFGNYVYQFVSHFKGRVRHVIIWNEPNVTLEWGFRPVDPEAYTELLRVAYTRAKEADPEVLVLGGALAPTLEPEGSDLAMNDLRFLERMYVAGAVPARRAARAQRPQFSPGRVTARDHGRARRRGQADHGHRIRLERLAALDARGLSWRAD